MARLIGIIQCDRCKEEFKSEIDVNEKMCISEKCPKCNCDIEMNFKVINSERVKA